MKQRSIWYIDDFGRYGCYIASLMSLAERHLKRSLTREEVEGIFDAAIRYGYIWHNNIPTDQNNWYRCFVVKPVELANLIFQWVNLELRVAKMYKGYFPQPDFTVACYKTNVGHHFVLANSIGTTIVNPDESIPLTIVESYRIFELEKVDDFIQDKAPYSGNTESCESCE